MKNIVKEIDHGDILAKRIEAELNIGNIESALYLAETFVFLFSGQEPATSKLIDLFIAFAQKLLKENSLEGAESVVCRALLIQPENSHLLSLLVEIKKKQHKLLRRQGTTVKSLAHSFVEKYFPEELDLFDIAWRVFKNILPEDFKQEAVAGALGAVGNDTVVLNTPRAIIIFNHLFREIEKITSEDWLLGLTKSPDFVKLKDSDDLIKRIVKFVLEEYDF